jgi:hypothetical protein
LEAGIEIDVGQLKQTGVRALLIAFVGSIVPLLVGFGLVMGAGIDSWKAGLAVGGAFAPTSLGVAASALGSGGVLNTPVSVFAHDCQFRSFCKVVCIWLHHVINSDFSLRFYRLDNSLLQAAL